MKPTVTKERLEMRVPAKLLERVDAYQTREQIPTRTQAVMDLLRRALDQAGC